MNTTQAHNNPKFMMAYYNAKNDYENARIEFYRLLGIYNNNRPLDEDERNKLIKDIKVAKSVKHDAYQLFVILEEAYIKSLD